MSILEENSKSFHQFPDVLRQPVEDELKAGHEIAEFGHGFPAAPCGAYIKLAHLVSATERVAIFEELLKGLMKRNGATACHFAAMLYFLHGKASAAFDWNHRPFFLRFNTDDLIERQLAVRELCETIGVDPVNYL